MFSSYYSFGYIKGLVVLVLFSFKTLYYIMVNGSVGLDV